MSLFNVRRKKLMQIILLLLGLVGAGIVMGRMFVDVSPISQDSEVKRTAVVQEEICVYFSLPDANGLMAERRLVPLAGDDFTALSQIVNVLAHGPESEDLSAVIPAQSRLLGAHKIDAQTLELNFNRELSQYHPGGSSSELLSIHALTNSIAAYVPEFTQFIFRIEGDRVESLKGHVDLSRPIKLDPNWINTDAAPLIPLPPE